MIRKLHELQHCASPHPALSLLSHDGKLLLSSDLVLALLSSLLLLLLLLGWRRLVLVRNLLLNLLLRGRLLGLWLTLLLLLTLRRLYWWLRWRSRCALAIIASSHLSLRPRGTRLPWLTLLTLQSVRRSVTSL